VLTRLVAMAITQAASASTPLSDRQHYPTTGATHGANNGAADDELDVGTVRLEQRWALVALMGAPRSDPAAGPRWWPVGGAA
jgi:hypothetical protein